MDGGYGDSGGGGGGGGDNFISELVGFIHGWGFASQNLQPCP